MVSAKNHDCIERVEIFDLLGNIVLSENYASANVNSISLNIQALSPGVYMVRLSVDGEIINRKVIIK